VCVVAKIKRTKFFAIGLNWLMAWPRPRTLTWHHEYGSIREVVTNSLYQIKSNCLKGLKVLGMVVETCLLLVSWSGH